LKNTNEGREFGWPCHQEVYWILRGEGGTFSLEQISEAILFLSNVTIGVLMKSGDRYNLVIHPIQPQAASNS